MRLKSDPVLAEERLRRRLRKGRAMKKLLLVLALLVTWAGVAAAAENVDIQIRVSTNAPLTVIDSQVEGVVTGVPYWNANVPLPYVTPSTNWLCVTSVTASMYASGAKLVGGNGAYVVVNHDIPGHDYHGFTVPPNVESQLPMAFPPGDALKISIASALGSTVVYSKIRIAGFLGKPVGSTREEACTP